MTFDIKKLSTAFVVALLLTSKTVVADTPELSEHDQNVLRATNVFYNLFATNALQAARAVISGNLTTNNLFVENNAVIDGTLTIQGAQTAEGGLTVNGPLTQVNGAVNLSNDGIGSAINIGNVATTNTAEVIRIGRSTAAGNSTISIGDSTSTGANAITIGNASSTGANTVDIGNTNAAASVALHAGTTGKVLYNVGAIAGTNYALNPIGSAETAAQRMAWAKISSAGAVSATSGVNNGPAGASGHFGITWSNAFAVAPTLSLTASSGTGIIFRFTASTTGASVDTLNPEDASSAVTNAGFNVIAIGA